MKAQHTKRQTSKKSQTPNPKTLPRERIACWSLRLEACLVLGVWCLVLGAAANPTFTVDARHPVGKVSPKLYGLMTEEINHSYDGGLYAELIQNRAFLDNATAPRGP